MAETTFRTQTSYAPVVDEVAVVAIVEGPDAGKDHVLDQERLTVGSGEAAGFRLSDRGVSRLHLELTREGAGQRVVDLGSKNGTFLAGCRVNDVVLGAGARIRLGSSTLEARVDRRQVLRSVWRGGDAFGRVLGTSPAMHRLFAQLEKVVQVEAPVLITGESGTGKEEVARAIHDASPRATAPFVVLDVAALSRSLADAELFGHVRGAFTGAIDDRVGAFERANAGTLFIDEIGELPLDLQPKLLRALEDGSIQRIGDVARRKVDVRIIAATHRPLAKMVNEKTFREDLYYRLAVLELTVPPLRERSPDVPLLARHFYEGFAPRDARAADIVEAALGSVIGYRWPGNVRELRSFVRRTIALGDPNLGTPPSLGRDPMELRLDLSFSDARKQWNEVFEREYVARLLEDAGGNVSEAARRAGMSRSRLYEIMDAHQLRKP
jgi:DNA-binding NtrC family response regulator